MKKLILTVTASLACVAAFAQGKVSFQTDSLHLAYYDASTDVSLAGQGVSSSLMPAGLTLVADLYAGTSSTALALVSTTSFSAVPGKWNATSVTLPGVAAGGVAFLAVQVRDNGIAAGNSFSTNRLAGSSYWGVSSVFSFTTGASVTYPVMWGAAGTWAAGTFPLDQYGAGSKGAIAVSAIPEPASFALAGLGIAALTILRRRK